MSKGRLEELEKRIDWIELRPSQIQVINQILEYAKEQAELVQELESKLANEFNGHKAIEYELSQRNKRYRKMLSQMNYARRELSGEEFIDICCDILIDFEALEGEE